MAEAGRPPGFARLLAMQVPADLADWLDMVAVGALLAFAWEAPPVAFAWLAVAMAVPPLTLGLLAGVQVDRWPLRRTLALSNLGRGLATAALLLVPSWPALVAVVALRAVAEAAALSALLVAPFLGAALAQAVSVGAAFAGGAAAMVVVAGGALLWRGGDDEALG